MEASSVYPGSVGEIIQGNYKGIDVLCSCPINLYTRVKVFESRDIKDRTRNIKSRDFIKNILMSWGYQEYIDIIDLEINSDIPRGKGFASSTADLCAAYSALVKLFDKKYNQDELIRQCITLEPSDSIMFDKLTLFDYKKGVLREEIFQYPRMNILVFHGERKVSTIEFNQRALPPLSPVNDLVQLLKNCRCENYVKTIGNVSTESIIRNKNRLNYKILQQVLEINHKTKGLGVIGAHSGDLLGIIYDDYERAQAALSYFNIQGYRKFLTKSADIKIK